MSLNRRRVVQGLAAAGLAMTGLRLAHAAPAAAPDSAEPLGQAVGAVTPLVAGSALDAGFLQGVLMAAQAHGLVHNEVVRLQAFDAAVFTRLSALLQAGEPAVLVGLADTASATLVIDLVRSAGGRVQSMAQHRLPDEAQAGHIAQALGQHLVRDGRAVVPASGPAAGRAFVSFCCVI